MTDSWMVQPLADGRWSFGPLRPLAPEQAPRGNCAVNELAALLPAPPLLLLDGRLVTTLRADIPARSDRQALQAAAFAVEEELAEDIESLRVVCGAKGQDGHRAVAVIRQDSLTAAWTQLSDAGCAPSSIIPDYLALPWQEDSWTVHMSADRLLVRSGRDEGFACDLDLASVVLTRALAAQRVEKIISYGPTLPFAVDGPEHVHQALPSATWELFSRGLALRPTLDLLPDEWRPRTRVTGRPLALAAGVLCLAVLAHVGLTLQARSLLQTDLETLSAREASLMGTSFPEVERVVNPEIQAAQTLADLRARAPAGDTLLGVLQDLGAAITEREAGIEFSSVNFADGILGARVEASDIAVLEQLRTDLAPMLNLEIVSVEAREGGILGSLRITPAATGTP